MNSATPTLFPTDVEVSACSGTDTPGDGFRVEIEHVRRAVPKRRNEFLLGRDMARQALAKLGRPACAIPVGPQREPVWPPGFIGSITHCVGFCGAAVARSSDVSGIGFDVERLDDGANGLERMILTDAETRHAVQPTVLAFSAKESVFKCLFPLVRRFIKFHEVEIRFDDLHTYSVRSELAETRALEGRYVLTPSHVFTSACIYAPSTPC